MHELSIAHAVVGSVTDAAVAAGAARVEVVRLRIGALSGVVPGALEFCFEVAAEGTVAEGARLEIELVPVSIHCPACDVDVELPTTTRFRCPRCDTPSAALVGGRELDLVSISVVDAADGDPERQPVP